MSNLAPESIEESLSDSLEEVSPLIKTGALLKKEREKQKISTKELADSLRIGEEQLIALENGRDKLLPELVFIKAMIRRTAERLHIDPIPLIEQFEQASNKINNRSNNGKSLSIKKSESTTYKILKDILSKTLDRFSERVSMYSLSKVIRKLPFKTLSYGIIALSSSITIIYLIAFRSTSEINKDQPVSSITVEKDLSRNKDVLPSKYITISSIKPSKITLINHIGEVLFEGIVRESKEYKIGQGLDIYAEKPELIQIHSGDNYREFLGKKGDLKWVTLKEKSKS